MAGIARVSAEMVIDGPLGAGKPLEVSAAEAVTNWVGPFSIEIATGVSEQSLIVIGTQGMTTITDFFITADQNISVTYGAAGSNVPVPLNAGGVHVLGKTSLTAISVSNASGSTAKVTYAAGGA